MKYGGLSYGKWSPSPPSKRRPGCPGTAFFHYDCECHVYAKPRDGEEYFIAQCAIFHLSWESHSRACPSPPMRYEIWRIELWKMVPIPTIEEAARVSGYRLLPLRLRMPCVRPTPRRRGIFHSSMRHISFV